MKVWTNGVILEEILFGSNDELREGDMNVVGKNSGRIDGSIVLLDFVVSLF